jgi:hypothetical protein
MRKPPEMQAGPDWALLFRIATESVESYEGNGYEVSDTTPFEAVPVGLRFPVRMGLQALEQLAHLERKIREGTLIVSTNTAAEYFELKKQQKEKNRG